MIVSFKDKETEKIFKRIFSKKLPHNIQRKIVSGLTINGVYALNGRIMMLVM